MKNARMSIYLLMALGFLSAYVPQAFSRGYESSDCCKPSCCEAVYDCGNPLNCGSINFWLRAGVAPTSWRNRGDLSLVSCNALAIPGNNNAIVPLISPLPAFKKLFHTPWIVGGQIGYAVTDCFEFYIGFNYRSASNRTFVATGVAIPNDTVTVTLALNNNYKAFDAFIGARAYWGRYWCDRFALFLGGQFGLVHHKANCFSLNISSTACSVSTPLTVTNAAFFFRNTRPAAGVNLGVDWCLGCGWSFVVMGEVIASCGPKSNNNILVAGNAGCPTQLPSLGGPTNFIVGGTGTELYFPVTFGFKYSF